MISQYLLLWFLTTVVAIPDVAFPFNSQVPPVARAGQLYQFTFSPTTFKPTGEIFQYVLAGAPTWLNLDSPTRTMFGTPDIADVGSINFTITAVDSTGRSVMQATLVVVAFEPPLVGASIYNALGRAGKMCGPSSIVYTPRTSFAFSFPNNIFTETGKQITYYSTLSDHTPLPGWLAFSPQSLSFSGTTPTLSASPQQFTVLIIASDVVGFAGAWLSFTIVVSDHQFYFEQIDRIVYIGPIVELNVNDLRNQLILDGVPVSDNDLFTSTATNPKWISFNPSSLLMTGTPPDGIKTQNVSVAAQDIFGDVANMTLHLRFMSGLFLSEVGVLNATAGNVFNYTLTDSLFVENGLQISVDLESASNWLHYNSASRTISGTVPSYLPAQEITGEINVATPDGTQKDIQSFIIRVSTAQTPASTASTRPLGSSVASPTGGILSATGASGKTNSTRRLGMIVGIVLAILFAIIGGVVAIMWCRSSNKGLQRTRSAIKRTISRPTAVEFDPWNPELEHEHENLEKGFGEFERTSDLPPQIILDLSPDKSARQSSQLGFSTISPVKPNRGSTAQGIRNSNRLSAASSIINDGDALILDDINRTSWGYLDASTHKPHDSMRLATQLARASRQLDSNLPTDIRRLSRHLNGSQKSSGLGSRRSSMRHNSGGIPLYTRLTGLGHGKSPPVADRNSMMSKLQIQPQSSSSYGEACSARSMSAVSLHPLLPNSLRLLRQRSQLGNQQTSMYDSMLVNPRLSSIQRPLCQRGQRSIFFSGGHNSRGSTSNRQRSTILGLQTIHGSPDLQSECPTEESDSSDAKRKNGGSPQFESPLAPLHRNLTQTSAKTAKTWQTTTTATTDTAPGSNILGEIQPPIPSRTSAHKHEVCSFNMVHSRYSRPLVKNTNSTAERNTSGIRESILFASADESDFTSDKINGDGNARISGSVYSQSSVADTSPNRRPTRGKIPIGGVRVPPFTSPTLGLEKSIMSRPHPRASLKYDGPGSSAVRAPLRNGRGCENRFSGSGSSSGSKNDGVNGLGSFGMGRSKGDKPLLAMIRNASRKKTISVESVQTGGDGLKGKSERGRSSSRGDEAFL
jgi:hypothetical protein